MNRIRHYSHQPPVNPSEEDLSFDFPSEWSDMTSEWEHEWAQEAVLADARVYLPRNYEPKYAYPLIVYLQSSHGSTSDFQYRMEQISTQNYVGLEIDLQPAAASNFKIAHEQIETAVLNLREHCNLHTERIYLMGEGAEADQAIEVVLNFPESYAGFIAVGPERGELRSPLKQFRRLKHLRGYLQSGNAAGSFRDFAHLLHDAGVKIHWKQGSNERNFQPTIPESREIDHFVMQGIWESYL